MYEKIVFMLLNYLSFSNEWLIIDYITITYSFFIAKVCNILKIKYSYELTFVLSDYVSISKNWDLLWNVSLLANFPILKLKIKVNTFK